MICLLSYSWSTQNINKSKLTRNDSTVSTKSQAVTGTKPASTNVNVAPVLLDAGTAPASAPLGHRRNNSQMSDSETSDMKSSSEDVSSKSTHSTKTKKSHDDQVSSSSSSPELARKKWTAPATDNTVAGPQQFRLTDDDIKISKKNLLGKQRDGEARSRRASSVGEHSSDDEKDKHKHKRDKEKEKKRSKDKEIKDKDKERSKSPTAVLRKLLRSSSSSAIEKKGIKKQAAAAATPEADAESSEGSPTTKRRSNVPQIVMTPSTPPLNLSSGSLAVTTNSINSITGALSLDNTPYSSPHASQFNMKKFNTSMELSSSSELKKSSGGLDQSEIELEVEDLNSANYLTMSMSRKGTMRNYVRENFANSRARSNSVVASRPGGEILAKRKPTASTLKTN
jgi:hypothetical protein